MGRELHTLMGFFAKRFLSGGGINQNAKNPQNRDSLQNGSCPVGAFTNTQKLPAGSVVARSHCSQGINEMAKKSKLLKRVCARHTMKNEYGFYGKSTARLEASLGAGDREILERYLTFCSTTAGPGKIKDYKMYMLQFRDVIEKPLDEITKDDAVAFWALVNHSPHEANTKIMIRRTAKRFLKCPDCSRASTNWQESPNFLNACVLVTP